MRHTAVIASVGIVVALYAGVVAFQMRLSAVRGPSWQHENMTYLPSSDRIRPALLGFDATVAHYLWIRTILYFGSHYMTDRNLPWLVRMVDIITRLNPYFYPAYEFAGLIVPDLCGNSAASQVILERGVMNIGDRKWNVHFYLGMLHFNYRNDKIAAARHFAMAAQVPGAPKAKLASLAAAFYSQAGQVNQGKAFLKFMYETSENPDVRRHILDKWNAMELNTVSDR